MKSKKYRPSNASEGDCFYSANCQHCVRDNGPNDPCDIYLRSVAFDIDDPEYPPEWTYDKHGRPTCTGFAESLENVPYKCTKTADMLEAAL